MTPSNDQFNAYILDFERVDCVPATVWSLASHGTKMGPSQSASKPNYVKLNPYRSEIRPSQSGFSWIVEASTPGYEALDSGLLVPGDIAQQVRSLHPTWTVGSELLSEVEPDPYSKYVESSFNLFMERFNESYNEKGFNIYGLW